MQRVLEIILAFKEYLVLVLLCSISLLLFAKSDTPALRNVRAFSVEIFGAFESTFSGLSRYVSLVDENNTLLVQNIALADQVNFLRWAKTENSTLRTLLHFKAESDYSLKAAQVIDKSITLDRNLMMLNLGSADSIKIDMVAVTDVGLVGRVILTSRNFCIVQPIINKDFKASAMIERTRGFGILAWNGESFKEADLLNIPLNTPIQKGDHIITSEYSSFAPAGLQLGTVSSVTEIAGQHFYKVKVALSVDFSALEVVFIQTRQKNIEQDDLRKRYKEFQ